MTSTYEIPLQAYPQTLQVTLGGIAYQLRLYYRNITNGGWTLDILDISSNNILNGVPLVTGCNLLEQYGYLNIGNGGGLYVQTTSDPDAVPTFENLGSDGNLYWVTA